MMTPDTIVLTPAKDVDVEGALARYEAAPPARGDRELEEAARIAANRSVDGAAPLILDLAAALRGGPAKVEGWTLRAEETPTPWITAVSATSPTGWGLVYAVEVSPPVDDVVMAIHDPENTKEAILARLTEGGTKEAPRFGVLFAQSKPRMELAERIVAEGIVEGLPSPADVRKVTQAKVLAFRGKGASPEFVREMSAPGLAETIRSLVGKAYQPGLMAVARPPIGGRDGDPIIDNPDSRIGGLFSMAEAFAPLRHAFRALLPAEAVAARNDEVGSRLYQSVRTRPDEVAMAEAIQGAVHRDGGTAGETVAEAMRRGWEAAVGHMVLRRDPDLAACLRMLPEHGHVTRKAEYDCNDGRTAMWVPEGGNLALMRSQHGTYAARRVPTAKGTIVEIGRVGGPNARETAIDVDASLRPGAETYRGGYLLRADGGVEVLSAPFVSDRSVRDINDLLSMVASVSCCAEADYEEDAPAP